MKTDMNEHSASSPLLYGDEPEKALDAFGNVTELTPDAARNWESPDGEPVFSETPSGRWFRCKRCGKLFPTGGYRTCTRAIHYDFECNGNLLKAR